MSEQMTFACTLADEIMRAERTAHAPTVSRKFRLSRVMYTSDGPQVIFGWESVERAYSCGFNEYATVKHVWPVGFDPGWQAVWMLTLHETAHAVTFAKHGDVPGAAHGALYQAELSRLIRQWPLAQVMPSERPAVVTIPPQAPSKPAPQTCQQWFDSEDEKAAAPRFKRGVVVLR